MFSSRSRQICGWLMVRRSTSGLAPFSVLHAHVHPAPAQWRVDPAFAGGAHPRIAVGCRNAWTRALSRCIQFLALLVDSGLAGGCGWRACPCCSWSAKKAKRTFKVDRLLAGRDTPWPDEIDLLVVRSSLLTEAILFHRVSRTLILTDLIENFEPERSHGWLFKGVVRLAGLLTPTARRRLTCDGASFVGARRCGPPLSRC